MKKQQKTQLILVSIGLLLFVLTYLYYPNINEERALEKDSVKKDFTETSKPDQSTTFENIQYDGIYDLDKPFKVESKKAYILNEEPDIVYMTNMHVILYLGDNRVVEITSLKGRYNKVNYNCFFEEDVLATDGDTKITAKNLDLLATKNFVQIYNNVNLYYPTGSLRADKIDYNFETKYFKVSMFDDKRIKMKVIQWLMEKSTE